MLEHLLRPAVRALERLQHRRVTHRAIRPDNLFGGAGGQPVVLGSAWAAPPASLQPALFEPPYAAMCPPSARGEGTAADDVYALGVTMLVLALGRLPLAGLEEREIIRIKLEFGSFRALAGDERLSGVIGDLLRGMLAEDPEHRPPLALLADPGAARSRRVAARQSRRAQRPFDFCGQAVWDARSLSFAISCDPAAGLAVLRDGSAERWLRRSLGEPAVAARIADRVAAARADQRSGDTGTAPTLIVQATSILDPLAPLCWPGIPIWPDGLGPALAAAQGDPAGQAGALEAIVEAEALRSWGNEREERCELALLRTDARLHRATLRARQDGALCLLYMLNPLLPCDSPALAGRCAVRVAELVLAIEALAGDVRGQTRLVDRHIAAFAAVRTEQPVEAAVLVDGPGTVIAQLRMLARLQARFHPAPLPNIGRWFAGQAGSLLATWHNKARRQQLEAELKARAETGQLGSMLALIEDEAARAVDADGAARATELIAATNAELERLEAQHAEQTELARRLGQELAAGVGLAALVGTLAVAAFG